jgi:hypothetical protein
MSKSPQFLPQVADFGGIFQFQLQKIKLQRTFFTTTNKNQSFTFCLVMPVPATSAARNADRFRQKVNGYRSFNPMARPATETNMKRAVSHYSENFKKKVEGVHQRKYKVMPQPKDGGEGALIQNEFDFNASFKGINADFLDSARATGPPIQQQGHPITTTTTTTTLSTPSPQASALKPISYQIHNTLVDVSSLVSNTNAAPHSPPNVSMSSLSPDMSQSRSERIQMIKHQRRMSEQKYEQMTTNIHSNLSDIRRSATQSIP